MCALISHAGIGSKQSRVADFAVVRRFQTNDNMAQFPWDLRYDMQCSNFRYATEFRLQRD
jgi:hypothetical protein